MSNETSSSQSTSSSTNSRVALILDQVNRATPSVAALLGGLVSTFIVIALWLPTTGGIQQTLLLSLANSVIVLIGAYVFLAIERVVSGH
jgi:hypothetical protein